MALGTLVSLTRSPRAGLQEQKDLSYGFRNKINYTDASFMNIIIWKRNGSIIFFELESPEQQSFSCLKSQHSLIYYIYLLIRMLQNRRGWTSEQDKAIVTLVRKFGTKNWAQISEKMSSRYGIQNRTGKQCRERWHNHLDPDVNKEVWTSKEEKIMFEAHQRYGNKWTEIAKLFQGRTDNDIKNHFYSMLRRSLRRVNKILGMRNSTKKIRLIKPSVLSKIFCSNGMEQADKLEQLLAQALFQFSKSKSPLDLNTIIDFSERRRLEQLIQKLAVYNEQYEAGQLLKKDSKKSRDQDSQAQSRAIFIINHKQSKQCSIENEQRHKNKRADDNSRANAQKRESVVEKEFNESVGCFVKKGKLLKRHSEEASKARQTRQLLRLQNNLIQSKDDTFTIKKNEKRGSRKDFQQKKDEPVCRVRQRLGKSVLDEEMQQPQALRSMPMTQMQRKSSLQSMYHEPQQLDIPNIFLLPDLHMMERRSSSYNDRKIASHNFLSSSTPTMDAKLFTRTPKQPTPNMFLSRTMQSYEWKANNEELDMIVNETREAIHRKIK